MKKISFSSRLKLLLEQKQLTLAEVARSVGTSTPSVHRWTRGGEIEYDNLRLLAKFLDVNWIWLRYGDEALEGLQDSLAANGSVADERRKFLGEIMESEARMNLAQEMARIVTWEWNVLTDELTASSNSKVIFGQSIDNLHSDLLPFRDFDLDALKVKFASSNLGWEWDFSLPSTTADERWFASRGQLLFDSQDHPIKVVAISIDITERKQMEKTLEHSEYVMRKVMETIPVGLFIADDKGRISTVNPEAERIWGGKKLVELEGYGEYKGWWESTGKQVLGSDWTLARAVKHGQANRGEVVNIEAFDGELRTIIMSAIPLLDINNKIIGAIEVNQDITTLKRVEDSLKVTAEQWKSTFEQPLIGIAYYKSANDFLHVNARFAELVNSSAEELAQDSLENLFDENTRKSYLMHLDNTQAGETAKFMTHAKLQGKTGLTKELWLSVICNPVATSAFKTLVFAFEPNLKISN
ncbi:MAG: PAS domain S-box protein [Methylotenera sp.]